MAKMQPDDPAYWMLLDDFTTTPDPEIYDPTCYICRDPEYAQMGLPLCKPCIVCGKHVPADDNVCKDGHEQPGSWVEELVMMVELGRPVSDELLKNVALEMFQQVFWQED